MPFDALGNFIPDDEQPSLDAMQYELAQKKPSTLDIVKAGIQNMPGASFAQGVAPLVNFPFQVAGSTLYGLGKQLISPEADFNKDTTEAMRALQYEPPTQAGKEFQESIGTALEASKLPPYIGHMPPMRFNANDARVIAKQNIERAREVGRIPEDFRNAQEGLRRESPLGGETYGSTLGSLENATIGEYQRNKIRKASENAPSDTAYDPLRKRREEASVEVYSVPEGATPYYAVRNTGEGQMIRPQPTPHGMEPNNVDFGETEALLKEIAPPLTSSRPQDIIDAYEQHYMTDNTPATRQLNHDWDKFQTEQIKKLYPDFSQTDAFKALRSGYSPNLIQDMKLKWFHDFVAQEKAKGAPIPTMEEFFGRAQAANTLTKKIIPNIIQKYIGTPNDPFLEMAKKGVTMNPADELVERYGRNSDTLRSMREQAGFAREGEVADKLMPVAESKLATQSSELDNLIAEQNQIGQTEGMMVPYPDGRIDPETGSVMLATNPNYAKYTNKIGALRKAIEDTKEEIRNLQVAQAYENVSDASIRMAPAFEWRNRIAPSEQQFHPAIFGEKERATPEAEREFKTPATAPFFEANVEGLKKAGIVPLAKDLIGKIMSGEIPPEQVPSLSQPHTITKFMADIVAPRLEKEKAARLAQVNYKQNVENHFQEVLNNPAVQPLTDNTKLLWLDDAYDDYFIHQALSDETFVLDHCIGQAGNGRGLKNLFTGEERSYIPYLDPVTGNPFDGASGTSSYMDRIESGDLDIMSIRDAKTGLPVGTIELNKTIDPDTDDLSYDIGYVSGYKNKAIKPEYREALRDALNKVKDSVVSSDGNENKSGVYDMRDRDQMNRLHREVQNKLPSGTTLSQNDAFKAITKSINDTLDGDRYVTIDQVEQAIEDYKKANPPVPVVRQPAPAGRDVAERNIVMQGLSRENLNTSRQFDAARIVADNNLFTNLPSTQRLEEGPRTALQTLLRSEERRADARGISDYQLFRNLQTYVDQINDGSLRFGDFGLRNGSELLELETGLQRHADAIGQLAHYADVLQRNGFRSPLPSETLNSPEWQAYQRFMGELAIDNPNDLRTRLRDMIEHGDPRELNANLDAIQVENFKHLLEIHDRAIKQAIDHPAPTASAQQRGIPLAQWSDVVFNALNRIETDHGLDVRSRVGEILADAIGSQMDTPVNERPIQVANFLENARIVNGSQQVRRGLRTLQSEIERANADIQNARNAPQTPALPTENDVRNAINRGIRNIPSMGATQEVLQVYDDIANTMVAGNLDIVENPIELVRRLTDRGNSLIGEGEPDVGNGLLAIAREVSALIPANPPASMALANQNAVRNQPNRQLVAGQEALSNSIIDAMNDEPTMAPAISDRLNALQWREDLVNDPARLIRNLRIEADAEANAGDERFASSLYDIANLIADERGETLFTPAGRQAVEPRRTPRDIAETVSAPVHQGLTQRIAQVEALTNAINEEIRSIPEGEAGLRQAELFYQDPNNLPASIVDHTHQFEDAERIANYLLQHVRSRLANRPENRGQDLEASYARVSDEIRNTYTQNYLQRFNDGDMDIRNNVLQDVADRPAVYGMARLNAQQQRDLVERLRTEGLAPQDMEQQARAQLPAPAQTANFPDADQFRGIARRTTNEFTGSQDSFYRIARDLRNMTPEDRLGALERMIRDTGRRAQDDAGQRATYGVDSPAGMRQLNEALLALREDLRDRELLNQLQAPVDNGNNFSTIRQINDAITQRGLRVNQEQLGISQRFDEIVEAARQEANPLVNTAGFITSLNYRAGSVARNGDNEGIAIAQQLHQLANDVSNVMNAQAPALPAPNQEVNQPRELGALDRNDRNLINGQSVNFLNGDRNALRQLSPVQRELAEVLTRAREPDPTLINELVHRRLINTLTSQTYSPTTDGEALVRLADTRSGMFAELDEPAREQVKDIIEKWNFSRFPNYRPPEAGMGLEPEGHKRGGAIRKRHMNDGGQPPALTPYEQFKIDNAERIRQGQEINENRNKYDPYKGSDKPIPTQRSAPRGGGSAGTIPSGSGTTLLDRPHLYSIGGKVYMEIGGGVKPVPNVPYTPEKTNPNTTDHVIKRPVDEGFREIYERVRNTPKPTGSAGTMPSGNGASYLDRPHLYARGGRVHMYEGGSPDDMQTTEPYYGSMGHGGIDPRQDTKVPAEYSRSGLPEVTGDPYDVWETKYNLNQATRDNLNFNDPAYTLGIKEVRASTPMDASWGGFHSSDEPDVVHIKNIHAEPQFYSQTLTHEGQHLQDYKTDQNKFKPKGHIDALEYLYKTGNQYLNQRAIENNYQAYRDKWVAEHPDEMPYNKLGAYWNVDAPFNERIADLNSLEGELKRGERFADTPMGKEVLNTPELQNYYYQSVRPMEPKAVAYEPTVFDRIRNAGRNFQEKVGSGKSYANSAYESAKEFKDGGDVNIDAMRLALTKG